MSRVLVTGGAGFIGSHLCDELIEHGHTVRVLDNFDPQVHPEREQLSQLNPDVELLVGDVSDPTMVERALDGIEIVYHLASAVGVGQSMYRIVDYVRTNNLGTATLLEEISLRPVDRLIVASSMSVYGEGSQHGSERIGTTEKKQPSPRSLYALQKLDQERAALLFGEAYRIPTTALRLFNVYGSRQSLRNPYTGVLAIFASQVMSGARPVVFEDGGQLRDFVHVREVARAFRLALDPKAAGEVINVGTGVPTRILDLALLVAQSLGSELRPIITGERRVGDVRSCFADIRKARRILGFKPEVDLEAGVYQWAEWVRSQEIDDQTGAAYQELAVRGLVR